MHIFTSSVIPRFIHATTSQSFESFIHKYFSLYDFQVIDEMNAMQNNIDNLKMALAEKENPLKLAHTRLDKRSRRPGIELCADAPQYRLVSEVGEINASVDRLRQRLAESQRQLENLAQRKATLEDDINTKTNTIFLDRDQCMTIRKQVRHIQH